MSVEFSHKIDYLERYNSLNYDVLPRLAREWKWLWQ